MKFQYLGFLLASLLYSSALMASHHKHELKLNLGVSLITPSSVEIEGGDYNVGSPAVISGLYEYLMSEHFSLGGELQYQTLAKAEFSSRDSTDAVESSYRLSTLRLFLNFIATKRIEQFSPFVGFGVGTSNNQVKNFQIESVDLATGAKTESKIDDGNSLRFAYHIFGGMDFDISESFFAGFSLKYANLGKFETGRGATVNGTYFPNGTINTESKNEIKVFEFALGLGWMI